jgi:RNA polymerase sigma-70 factor (ECF subfamily)
LTGSDNGKNRINELLERWSNGDPAALSELIPLVYQDLRRIAGYLFNGERKNHTLQPTIIVAEAFIKLKQSHKVACRDGAHFLAIYARAMRQILIDYARRHNANKRYGETVPLDEVQLFCRERHGDLLAMIEAMDRLTRIYPRQASVVDLRVFCGLNNSQVAKVLKIAANTVMRDWKFASDWLRREMKSRGTGERCSLAVRMITQTRRRLVM